MWNPATASPFRAGSLLVLASALRPVARRDHDEDIDNVRQSQFQAWVGTASVIPLAILTAAFETDQYSLGLRPVGRCPRRFFFRR